MSDHDEQLRRAFAARTAGGQPLGDDTSFFEAGLTSARLAELVADLQAQGADITLIDAFRYPTLRELAAALARRAGEPHRPPAESPRLPWDF